MLVQKQVVEVKVPESWKDAADEGLFMAHANHGAQDAQDFVNNIQCKINAQEGNSLPVSAFTEYVDGTTPSGTAAYEKRGYRCKRTGMAARKLYPV